MNAITISLVCRRKDYKRPVSHLKKKRKEKKIPFLRLKSSDMKANAITISLACKRKYYKRPVSHLKKKKKKRPVSYTEVT